MSTAPQWFKEFFLQNVKVFIADLYILYMAVLQMYNYRIF